VNPISLENWVGVAGERKSVADWLTKGRREGGRNVWEISFIPEGTLPVHWGHQVDLSKNDILYKKQTDAKNIFR
jgi:hypothetical protein